MIRVVAIIQARMGSSRLPGKVMRDLAGEPMLARVVRRTSRAARIDHVVVATTTDTSDDPVARLCAEQGWGTFRGSRDDVLDRYYRAALAHDAGAIVRITSDCPLIDPPLVDRVIERFLRRPPVLDYCSNVYPERTYPRGLDTEVVSISALERSWMEDRNPALREHVTQYILRHPDLFSIGGIRHETDLSAHRWTVDTPEDYSFVQQIYHHFGHDQFSWSEVLAYLEEHPEIVAINRDVRQKVI
jgi:spore coat polysaccharide biosynthesis protein SpsF